MRKQHKTAEQKIILTGFTLTVLSLTMWGVLLLLLVAFGIKIVMGGLFAGLWGGMEPSEIHVRQNDMTLEWCLNMLPPFAVNLALGAAALFVGVYARKKYRFDLATRYAHSPALYVDPTTEKEQKIWKRLNFSFGGSVLSLILQGLLLAAYLCMWIGAL